VRPHRVDWGEACAWSLFYIGVAVALGVWFTVRYETELGTEVFVVIMSTFTVPKQHQHKVFTIGIVLALVLRAIFIAMGTALLALFLLIFPLFGILLIYTAVQLFRHRDKRRRRWWARCWTSCALRRRVDTAGDWR
jgi:tellurite resistance protein TerC